MLCSTPSSLFVFAIFFRELSIYTKGPTRADIAQLPVVHAHTPSRVTSLPVAMVLVLSYHILYYYSKKKMVHACATESCTISALVGCSLGRLRHISSMATGTSPFTGYLPLSRHFIFIITFLTKVCCFRICCVVLPRDPLRGHVTFGHYG
jgi:hypothetical protein